MSLLETSALLTMGELQWWGILVPLFLGVDSSLDVCKLEPVISPRTEAALCCLPAFFSLESFTTNSH